MSARNHWLLHRGDLRGLAADEGRLVFVTAHPEGSPTALYRLDPATAELESQPMPGGVALAGSAARWWVAGADGHVWAGAFGALAPIGARMDPEPTAVAGITGGRVAVLAGAELVVLDPGGTPLGRFALAAPGTALAADPTGEWLAVGSRDGTVAVFRAAEPGGVEALESARLHQGDVHAVRFEDHELRFRSVGADHRFLITHARGALEPIDRGGRHGHSKPVRGIVGHGDWVYTAGEDGQLKAWRRGTKRAPATQKQGVGVAVGLAELQVEDTAVLAVACADRSIRLFPLGDDGRIGDRTMRFHGAIATSEHELARREPDRRRIALEHLEAWGDAASIELVGQAARGDADHQLRLQATEVLGRLGNPRAVPHLEDLLGAPTEAVRGAALKGLRSHVGPSSLRPLRLALEAGAPDVGLEAVGALRAPAATDEQAHVLVVGALGHGQPAVRDAALGVLEALHPSDPTASLLGLRSAEPTLRWRALLRLLQREMLPLADRALRAATEDPDADVRQTAYHLRLLASPGLAATLRALDPDLHRNLHALLNHGQEAGEPPAPARPPGPPEGLSVLLQAASARQRDTCLRGASHLALLGDGRAFGVLLQLSREGEPAIQVRACRALHRLDDSRALGRMRAMLRSDVDQVRDAAFSVVERLLDTDPLQAAGVGLSAPHADVRARGLRALIGVLDQGTRGEAPLGWLRRALDDADERLRLDAFKAALRLQIGGDEPAALRFALQSLREDVRREALTEIMAQVREDWAWRMLLARFDDPAPALRREALAYARKQGRAREPDPVVAALGSVHADLRLEAVRVLAERADDRARPLLVRALDDDDEPVRRHAFAALQRSGLTQAMVDALASRHADVRIGAASSLAEAGRAEALEPLLAQVRAERPVVADLASRWADHVRLGLEGLAWLRRPEGVEPAAALLSDSDASIRRAAARALAYSADSADALAARLPHRDPEVQRQLALGLAWRGDASAAGVIFEGAPGAAQLSASVALGDDERLLVLLDAPDIEVRALALRTVLLLAWTTRTFPHRLLAALTVEDLPVRLAVAAVLEAWNDPAALRAAIVGRIGHQGGTQPPRPIPEGVLRRMAIVLSGGNGLDRATVIEILESLGVSAESSADARDQAAGVEHQLQLLLARSEGRLSALPDPGPPPRADLTELVFGTYVGIGGQAGPPAARASALGRLARLPDVPHDAVIDALVPALADPHGAVRMAAFAALQAAGLATDALVAEALAAGQRDLGQEALTLMADLGSADALWDVLAQRDDGLQMVAFDLLARRAGEAATARAALQARAEDVRARAVAGLAVRFDGDPESRGVLTQALESRFPDVRRGAALALASHRDPAAFVALTELLNDDDMQRAAMAALVELPDPRVPGALLDRIERDPRGTADVGALIDAVGRARRAEAVPRLVQLMKGRDEHVEAILAALTTISGYDQSLQFEVAEPDADESWVADQHPRRDDLLATVLQHRADRGHVRALTSLFPGAMWAHGSDVDVPLARMLLHADDSIRRGAAMALGWRVRFRHADPAPLEQVLAHRDPPTAFLAAEALARAGASAGLTVLLAAVDTLDDVTLRRRAVLALGQLGDARALDKLLDIVDHDGHALIEAAAEAIGHLSATPKADHILRRLLQLSRGGGAVALQALAGLRWFGTPGAWARVRSSAGDPDVHKRTVAAELLRHDTTGGGRESRDVLERLVTRDPAYAVVQAAAVSLRRLLGRDSLEPDYAFLRARFPVSDVDTVARLRAGGDATRILAAVAEPDSRAELVEPLLLALASRQPFPVSAAADGLADGRPRAGAQAARLLGRARSLDDATRARLRDAAAAALTDWEARRDRDETLDEAEDRLRWMLWASARHGVGGDVLVRALTVPGPGGAAVRRAAAEALPLATGAVEQLITVIRRGDAQARALAAGALARQDPQRAEQLLPDILDDRIAAEPILAAGIRPASLGPAAGRLHVQGVVLPHLVLGVRIDELRAALTSPIDDVRLGAVDALGAIATVPAEQALRGFAADPARDDEERKAAWRAFRRSRRQRARQETAP